MPTQVLAASAIAIHVAAGASDEPISEIWFKTEPLTSHIIYRLAQLQLWTDSHDEAFQVADAASAEGSWFELCILANETETEPREQDGKALTWKSHSNRMGIEGMSRNFGAVFDRRGELLDALEVSIALCRVSNSCLTNTALCSRGMSSPSVLASDFKVASTSPLAVSLLQRCWRKVRSSNSWTITVL